MALGARSTMGMPVTLLMYGTVREALGLTSITYSSSPCTIYWTLTRPRVFIDSAISRVCPTIFSMRLSVTLMAG